MIRPKIPNTLELSLDQERTSENIARDYTSSLDSVTLINTFVAKGSLTDDEKDTIDRNVQHLEIVLAREGWTTEDLTPFTQAITAGKAVI